MLEVVRASFHSLCIIVGCLLMVLGCIDIEG
jgi:hypothetical protein